MSQPGRDGRFVLNRHGSRVLRPALTFFPGLHDAIIDRLRDLSPGTLSSGIVALMLAGNAVWDVLARLGLLDSNGLLQDTDRVTRLLELGLQAEQAQLNGETAAPPAPRPPVARRTVARKAAEPAAPPVEPEPEPPSAPPAEPEPALDLSGLLSNFEDFEPQ